MNAIIRNAIERPVAVMAMMMLVVLFGVVAFRTIPIQLSPDIEKPIYQIRVSWPGAARGLLASGVPRRAAAPRPRGRRRSAGNGALRRLRWRRAVLHGW